MIGRESFFGCLIREISSFFNQSRVQIHGTTTSKCIPPFLCCVSPILYKRNILEERRGRSINKKKKGESELRNKWVIELDHLHLFIYLFLILNFHVQVPQLPEGT